MSSPDFGSNDKRKQAAKPLGPQTLGVDCAVVTHNGSSGSGGRRTLQTAQVYIREETNTDIMTVNVMIEFASSTDLSVMKDRGDKVKMLEDKMKQIGKGNKVNVKVKRVLDRNKFDVTIAEELVFSQDRDGQLDAEKFKKIMDVLSSKV